MTAMRKERQRATVRILKNLPENSAELCRKRTEKNAAKEDDNVHGVSGVKVNAENNMMGGTM